MTPRKVLLRLGRRGRLVRVVEAVNHGDPVYVVTWTAGGKRRAKFFPRPRERAEALAFAEGVAEEQTRGDKPTQAAPITIQALWGALTRAKERAGIPHRPRRGAHGLRRLLAGEVNARTGNAKLAMDAIGDRDIRMMERYLRPREDAVRDAFEAMDAGNEQNGVDGSGIAN